MIAKTRIWLVLILLGQFFSTQTFARWQTLEDANTEIEFCNREIKVAADGTSVEVIEMQTKILKESGRSIWANYPLIYNGDTSKIEIIEAKTIYKGEEYFLNANLIEDKPLASSPQGFDQHHQITLAYPNAEVGAKLYLKYKTKNHTTMLKDYFATRFIYGENGFWSKAQMKLKSELPLFMEVNDPDDVLQVSKNRPTGFTECSIKLKKPVYKEITDEKRYLVDPKNLPWVSISSVSTWEKLAAKVGPPYLEVINQPLPESFQKIREKALAEKDDYNRINIVTALLAEKIQYMGDWKTVKGKFAPHDLAHIAKVQLGDCKDFTVSAGAILQSLGYKVQPVLVMRGVAAYQPPNKLPGLEHSNHVFLKVFLPNKKTLWIDPTNFQSMANGIFPDIADKLVFVIDPKAPGLERTPATNPDKMQLVIDETWDLKDFDKRHAIGELSLLGERAIDLTGAQLVASEQMIKDYIFNLIGDRYLDAEKTINLPALDSRIVKDLTFSFEYEQNNSRVKTNLGPAIELPASHWVRDFVEIKSDQVSDIFVGPPGKIKAKLTIKNVTASNVYALNGNIATKWLDVERKVEQLDEKTLAIQDEVIVKRSFISSQELKTTEYLQLKNRLERNFKKVAIVVQGYS